MKRCSQGWKLSDISHFIIFLLLSKNSIPGCVTPMETRGNPDVKGLWKPLNTYLCLMRVMKKFDVKHAVIPEELSGFWRRRDYTLR